MGCTGSKLAGDEFSNIEATALSSTTQAFRHSKTPAPGLSSQDNRSPSFGSHAYMGTLPLTGKPKATKSDRKRLLQSSPPLTSAGEAGRSIDDSEPPPPPRPLMLDGVELKPKAQTGGSIAGAPGSERFLTAAGMGRQENEELLTWGEKRFLRTDEERKLPDPVTGKKPGLYARYTNKRLGVGEERDPVTGRGAITGMTMEETKAYVERTRGYGMMGDKHQYFVGGYSGLGMA